MFNSPILDVTIGLVFVFLIYSLLATSINEAIATGFALRARMLKDSIVKKMLSNTPVDNKLISFLKGILIFFQNIIYRPDKKPKEKNIGDQFYDHPIVKNYGSSRFFKDPSYLTASNFSTILTDVLKEDFSNKIEEIALFKNIPNTSLERATEILNAGTDISKIKNLIEYYAWYYAINPEVKLYNESRNIPAGLDKETHCILQLHLRNSLYDIDDFKKKIEQWFDDTQDRVSGWYKRQMQFLLFCMGIVIAISFNVDTIQIVNRLSTSKDAREQAVQLAIKAADTYKDDPRANRNAAAGSENNAVVSTDSLRMQYEESMNYAKKLVDGDINKANEILALGWSDYGRNDSTFLKKLQNKIWFGLFYWDDSCDIMQATVKEQRNLLDPKTKLYTDSLYFYSSLYRSDSISIVSKKDSSAEAQRRLAKLNAKRNAFSDSVNSTWATYENSIRIYNDSLKAINNEIKTKGKTPVDSLKLEQKRIDSVYRRYMDYAVLVNKYRQGKEGNDQALMQEFYSYQYKHYPIHVKTAYILYSIWTQKKKLIGFLLTAFAICLGAPFWFDLLNKLVSIRGTGKKEDTNSSSGQSAPAAVQQPAAVAVNVNTQQPGEEEAVG